MLRRELCQLSAKCSDLPSRVSSIAANLGANFHNRLVQLRFDLLFQNHFTVREILLDVRPECGRLRIARKINVVHRADHAASPDGPTTSTNSSSRRGCQYIRRPCCRTRLTRVLRAIRTPAKPDASALGRRSSAPGIFPPLKKTSPPRKSPVEYARCASS